MNTKTIPLGKKSEYVSEYDPSLLFPIARQINREKIGVQQPLPFKGVDFWNAYEISWLNEKGKPEIAISEFVFPCESELIVESKSLKLYLNSFTNSRFSSRDHVKELIEADVSKAVKIDVLVNIKSLSEIDSISATRFTGTCLDTLDISCDTYVAQPNYLTAGNKIFEETLYSDLLKSNCLVTSQPDWGSIQINYRGKAIDHAGLLRYIVSFRNVNEFAEQCVERIFMDIMRRCQPEKLTVYARYTRRGGLDINPIRSTETNFDVMNERLFRQ